MSVVIAGKCKKCGKQYWVSFGQPAWYKKWLKEKDFTGGTEKTRAWGELSKKEICPDCGPKDWEKFLQALAKED